MNVSNLKLYRATKLNGDNSACYQNLHKYDNIIRLMNLGTLFQIKCTKNVLSIDPIFHMFFISFATQKFSFFHGYWLFIGLDRCHWGVLVSVVLIVSNNSFFPVVVCIYDFIGVEERITINFMF